MHGLRKGIQDGTVVPVVCCSVADPRGPGQAAGQPYRPDALSGGHEARRRQSQDRRRRGARLRRGSALLRPASSRPWPTPSWASCRLLKVHFRRAHERHASFTTPTRKRPKRPAPSTSMRGKKQNPADKVVRGRYLRPGQAGSRQPPATRCATRTSPIKFDELEFPAPCISMAVYAKKAGEEDKIFSGLSRLMEEDPTIRVEKNPETTETRALRPGRDAHRRHRQEAGQPSSALSACCSIPKIPYRESIRKPIDVRGTPQEAVRRPRPVRRRVDRVPSQRRSDGHRVPF